MQQQINVSNQPKKERNNMAALNDSQLDVIFKYYNNTNLASALREIYNLGVAEGQAQAQGVDLAPPVLPDAEVESQAPAVPLPGNDLTPAPEVAADPAPEVAADPASTVEDAPEVADEAAPPTDLEPAPETTTAQAPDATVIPDVTAPAPVEATPAPIVADVAPTIPPTGA
jgi:hypothetical protein